MSAVSFAFVGLDADGGIRRSLLSLTALQEVPASFLRRWLTLIDLVSDQIDELQAEVERRLIEAVAATDINEVRAWPIGPTLSEHPDTAFTAKPARGRYPVEWTAYWGRID